MTTTATLAQIAADHDMQTYEAAAALDLGTDYDDHAELDEATTAECREILGIMVEQDGRHLVVESWHDQPVNGADAGSWQTVTTEPDSGNISQADLDAIDFSDHQPADGSTWRGRLVNDAGETIRTGAEWTCP